MNTDKARRAFEAMELLAGPWGMAEAALRATGRDTASAEAAIRAYAEKMIAELDLMAPTKTATIGGKTFSVAEERPVGPNTRRELGVTHSLALIGPKSANYHAYRREDGTITKPTRVAL